MVVSTHSPFSRPVREHASITLLYRHWTWLDQSPSSYSLQIHATEDIIGTVVRGTYRWAVFIREF